MKRLVYLLILMLFISACGAQSQTEPVTGSFAGRVEGSNAFVGLATNGERLIAFYCDGTSEAAPTLWGWFRGEVNGNAFDLTNENGDRLSGEFSADNANGTITLSNGTALNFQAERVNEPAGLYRHEETVDGVETITGWIVLANQELRGGTRSGGQLSEARGQPIDWIQPDVDP